MFEIRKIAPKRNAVIVNVHDNGSVSIFTECADYNREYQLVKMARAILCLKLEDYTK